MTTGEEAPKTRRARGEGGVSFDKKRQVWVAAKTVGYDARGKRIVRRGSGKTEAAALRELRRRVKDYEAGLQKGSERYTVREAVEDWLTYGTPTADENTRSKQRSLCDTHILPNLGGRRLRDLRAEEVDRWLVALKPRLATRSIGEVKSYLSRSINRAVGRGYAERNVVDLCGTPTGRDGRPSKALTLKQAGDVLSLTSGHSIHCYIVVAMLTGARTEEMRALRWKHVHLEDETPHLEVWRSVRASGDTKTRKSRRTLALPSRAVASLRRHRASQKKARLSTGAGWTADDLVFATASGAELDAANVRRDFRRALREVPGLVPAEWTPRELRHSFVSLLSDDGVPVEEIARLVGHAGGSQVTERVYRKQLRPVIETGATKMDSIFGVDPKAGSADA